MSLPRLFDRIEFNKIRRFLLKGGIKVNLNSDVPSDFNWRRHLSGTQGDCANKPPDGVRVVL